MPLVLFEWRRLSTAWWCQHAESARLSALILWKSAASLSEETICAAQDGYDAQQSLWQGFEREAGLALELTLKAVVVCNLEQRRLDPASHGVEATHDLLRLWRLAGLPLLPRDDCYRMVWFRTVLLWQGRYPVPLSAEHLRRDTDALQQFDRPAEKDGPLRPKKPITTGWSDFERLYTIARMRLYGVRQEAQADAVQSEIDSKRP